MFHSLQDLLNKWSFIYIHSRNRNSYRGSCVSNTLIMETPANIDFPSNGHCFRNLAKVFWYTHGWSGSKGERIRFLTREYRPYIITGSCHPSSLTPLEVQPSVCQTQLWQSTIQRGQSERILWLLEELSIRYNPEIHKRDPLLSPRSFTAIHPLGSAPVLVDGDLVLSGSMAVATYILTKYAPSTNTLTISPEDPTYPMYLYWLYYVLCTLQPAGSTLMFVFFDPNLPDDAPGRKLSASAVSEEFRFRAVPEYPGLCRKDDEPTGL